MTNEEIIKTTAAAFFNDALPNTPLPNGIGILISDVLKLKDNQFKEYLEDRLDSVENYSVCSRGDDFQEGMIEMLNEIINELFGEE